MFCLGLGALSRSDHQNPTESTDRHDASDNEEVASDSLSLNHHALDWESLPYKSCKGYADSCLNSHHDLKGMFAVYDGHDKWIGCMPEVSGYTLTQMKFSDFESQSEVTKIETI